MDSGRLEAPGEWEGQHSILISPRDMNERYLHFPIDNLTRRQGGEHVPTCFDATLFSCTRGAEWRCVSFARLTPKAFQARPAKSSALIVRSAVLASTAMLHQIFTFSIGCPGTNRRHRVRFASHEAIVAQSRCIILGDERTPPKPGPPFHSSSNPGGISLSRISALGNLVRRVREVTTRLECQFTPLKFSSDLAEP
jgi:hypothetical protein